MHKVEYQIYIFTTLIKSPSVEKCVLVKNTIIHNKTRDRRMINVKLSREKIKKKIGGDWRGELIIQLAFWQSVDARDLMLTQIITL